MEKLSRNHQVSITFRPLDINRRLVYLNKEGETCNRQITENTFLNDQSEFQNDRFC